MHTLSLFALSSHPVRLHLQSISSPYRRVVNAGMGLGEMDHDMRTKSRGVRLRMTGSLRARYPLFAACQLTPPPGNGQSACVVAVDVRLPLLGTCGRRVFNPHSSNAGTPAAQQPVFRMATWPNCPIPLVREDWIGPGGAGLGDLVAIAGSFESESMRWPRRTEYTATNLVPPCHQQMPITPTRRRTTTYSRSGGACRNLLRGSRG